MCQAVLRCQGTDSVLNGLARPFQCVNPGNVKDVYLYACIYICICKYMYIHI